MIDLTIKFEENKRNETIITNMQHQLTDMQQSLDNLATAQKAAAELRDHDEA